MQNESIRGYEAGPIVFDETTPPGDAARLRYGGARDRSMGRLFGRLPQLPPAERHRGESVDFQNAARVRAAAKRSKRRAKRELADPRREPMSAAEWAAKAAGLTNEEARWRRPLNPFDGGVL